MGFTRAEDGPLTEELLHDVRELLSPKTTQILFFAACALWISFRVVCTSYLYLFIADTPLTNDTVTYFVTLLVLACEAGVILNKGYDSHDAYAMIALIAMCAGPLTRLDSAMYVAAMLVFCARSFDVRKTLAFCTGVLAVTFLAILISAGTGLVADTVMDEPGRVRHNLGFMFFLNPSMYLFMLTCCVCVLRGEKLSLAEGAALLAANTLMFMLTDSETSFGLPVLLVLVLLALKIPAVRRANLGWLWQLLSWSTLIAAVVSLVLTFAYGVSHAMGLGLLDGLDTATRWRFSYGFNGLTQFGVKTLGQYIPWQGNGLSPYGYNPHTATYNYVDNMYVHLLMEQGWLYVLALVGLCTAVTRKALREGNHALLLAMAAVAAYGILNDLTMFLHYNLLLFAIAGLYGSRAVE